MYNNNNNNNNNSNNNNISILDGGVLFNYWNYWNIYNVILINNLYVESCNCVRALFIIMVNFLII